MLRLPRHSSHVTVRVEDPAGIAAPLRDILVEELPRVLAREVEVAKDTITFDLVMLLPVSRWDLLPPLIHGEIKIEHYDRKITVLYNLMYARLVIVSTVMAGILALAGAALGFPSISLFFAVVWLWLLGGSVLMLAARFNHFVRKCIKKAERRCADRTRG
mgnify:CR=1 FL=1